MKKIYNELLNAYNNILTLSDFENEDFDLYEIVKTILYHQIDNGNGYDIQNTKLYNIMLDYGFMGWLQNQTDTIEDFEIALEGFQVSKIIDLTDTIVNFLDEVHVLTFNDNEYIITELTNQNIAMEIENLFQGSEIIVNLKRGYDKISVVIYDIYDIEDFDDIQSFSELENYCNSQNLNIDNFKVEEIILN